jgi:hypothetical protein
MGRTVDKKALLALFFDVYDRRHMIITLLNSRKCELDGIANNQQVLASLADDHTWIAVLESRIEKAQARLVWIDETLALFED